MSFEFSEDGSQILLIAETAHEAGCLVALSQLRPDLELSRWEQTLKNGVARYVALKVTVKGKK